MKRFYRLTMRSKICFMALLAACGLAAAVSCSKSAESSEPQAKQADAAPAGGAESVEDFVNGRRFVDLDADGIESAVEEAASRFDSIEDRVRAMALFQLGTPYSGGPLGEEEEPDADPLFSLEKSDCTVLALTSETLANGGSVERAKDLIKLANYRRKKAGDAKPSYENRLHFTTDRLDFTPFDEDITASFGPDVEPLSREVLLNGVKEDGKRLLPIDWEKKRVVRYIPVEKLDEALLKKFPGTVGLAFVKAKLFDVGLDVVHEGILLDGKDLVHASSLAGEVARQPFLPYLKKDDGSWRYDGVVVYRFKSI